MAAHDRWTAIQQERTSHPEAQAAYDAAELALYLGEQIRLLRERQGMSRAGLAERAGTTPAAVERLELGDPHATVALLSAVARALDVELVASFARLKTIRSLEEIPAFASEDEEEEFWSTHQLSDELLAHAEPLPEEVRALLEQAARARVRHAQKRQE